MRTVFYIRNMATGMYVCNSAGEKREFILTHNLNTDIYVIVGDKS